jgi:hypothetical protein
MGNRFDSVAYVCNRFGEVTEFWLCSGKNNLTLDI